MNALTPTPIAEQGGGDPGSLSGGIAGPADLGGLIDPTPVAEQGGMIGASDFSGGYADTSSSGADLGGLGIGGPADPDVGIGFAV